MYIMDYMRTLCMLMILMISSQKITCLSHNYWNLLAGNLHTYHTFGRRKPAFMWWVIMDICGTTTRESQTPASILTGNTLKTSVNKGIGLKIHVTHDHRVVFIRPKICLRFHTSLDGKTLIFGNITLDTSQILYKMMATRFHTVQTFRIV